MLQELDPSVVADVTTCVLQYQELDPNVVAGVVADCTTHPFKRAQADWLFKLFPLASFPKRSARYFRAGGLLDMIAHLLPLSSILHVFL